MTPPLPLLLVAALALPACVGDTRALFDAPVTARADWGGAPGTCTFDDGTAASFSTATLTLSHLRFEAPAEEAERPAHPGHNNFGEIIGELLGTYTVDLLSDEILLGTGAFYAGDYATARLWIPAEEGGVGFTLTGETSGTAGVWPVELALPLQHEVSGVPFEVALDAAPPAVRLRFAPCEALSWVEWTDQDGNGRLDGSDATFTNTVAYGVLSNLSYSLDTHAAGTP